MTERELLLKYRAVLIQLARHYVSMKTYADSIRQVAQQEVQAGRVNTQRISGLFQATRMYNKRAAKLRDLLLDGDSSLKYFFGTTDLTTIANLNIIVL